MHRRDFLSATAATAAALHLPAHLLAAEAEKPLPIEYIDPDPATGSSKAVVVVPGVALAHTCQMLPVGKLCEPREGDGLEAQFGAVMACVDSALEQAGAEPAQVIKINVVLRNESDLPAIQKLLATRFSGHAKPAATFVVGSLPGNATRLAIDAIAPCAAPPKRTDGVVQTFPAHTGLPTVVACLPSGPKVYVSGQAEKGDPKSATRATLESLRKTLDWLSVDMCNVVQVKSFLTAEATAAGAELEIIDYFKNQPVPALAFVEWKSNLPIEIELVASAAGMKPPSESVGPIEFLTPPGMTASPVFSRVTRVWSDRTIYTSGLYGREGQNAEGQIRDIFAQLEDVLKKAGSDLRHMAKATYYVSTEEASAKLNAIRPEFYDPNRPPAASKAMVAGVGMPGRSVTLDMIAVPKE